MASLTPASTGRTTKPAAPKASAAAAQEWPLAFLRLKCFVKFLSSFLYLWRAASFTEKLSLFRSGPVDPLHPDRFGVTPARVGSQVGPWPGPWNYFITPENHPLSRSPADPKRPQWPLHKSLLLLRGTDTEGVFCFN